MHQISKRNAKFQQWEALIANRNKRQRAGEFLVQGVRPISLAIEHGWPVRALLHDADRDLSDWASGIVRSVATDHVAMSSDLLAELSGKDDGVAELVAVVEMPADDLSRISVGPNFLGLVFDRPSSPGNIGTVIRAADAFGAGAVIVTGHAADPYDPRAVRASTGSLFALPVVRERSHVEVLAWARQSGLNVVGTDESGEVDIAAHDLTGATLLVIGNETSGMSAGWRESCDAVARIPISGSASSLNAATAATVFLYEAARQRG
ncbi:TrmH family RNA methyltransferase [Aeromicrobium panaciterrae]|uniref:TrmH family RNA methyltransferase n=1 Tax=Aeromicrobium panaciterrae TaxID=363861 RepID=A0ABU1UJ71_9ACTN|nr:TrmH family RNA methyltransferase [Aeromicrobium panaciterrae]MDR7085195.1 TrmH family RNA methyltransferase [Aeromicrobium panaciterrae]